MAEPKIGEIRDFGGVKGRWDGKLWFRHVPLTADDWHVPLDERFRIEVLPAHVTGA